MAKPETTQDRILTAAEAVFAKSGWHGATTREIARAAKVNEVTLFRCFGTKNKLFVAVISRFIEKQRLTLRQSVIQNASLEEVLIAFADVYYESLQGSVDFIRAMLAELPRHPKQVCSVLGEVAKPLRSEFQALLNDRQKSGEIRRGVNCEALLDAFTGMLFSSVVKPRLMPLSYKPAEYRRVCVDLFMQGVKP